jgi:uncharacterized membrane protein
MENMIIDGNERLISFIVHLSPIIGLPIILPAVIYLAKKGENSLGGISAARALNFHLTMALPLLIAWLLMFVLIGFIILPLLLIWCVLQIIFALIATYQSKPYSYFPALPIFKG